MILLNLYIRKQVLKTITMVVLMFVMLDNFVHISLKLANGNPFSWHMITYSLYISPRNIYRALTVIVLISSTLVLYKLQHSKEWLIMSSFGNSNRRLLANVLLIQFCFILLMSYVGETLAIDLERVAKQQGTFIASSGKVTWNFNNLWFKEGNKFIHVNRVVNENMLKGIDQFEMKGNDLVRYSQAESANFKRTGIWDLHNIVSYDLKAPGVKALKTDMVWHTDLHPSVLTVASATKQRLSLQKIFWAIWNSKNLGILSDDTFSDFFSRVIKPFLSLASLCCVAPLLIKCRPRGFKRFEIVQVCILVLALIAVQQEIPQQFQLIVIALQMSIIFIGCVVMALVNRIR